MAERVDAVAVDVGDRAGGAELEVAAHQRDADRIARPQRRRRGARAAAARCLRRAGHAPARSPARGRPTATGAITDGIEAAERQRRRDRPQHRADAGVDVVAEHLHVGRAVGERPRPTRTPAAAMRWKLSGVSGIGRLDARGLAARRRQRRVASIISAIGVMPAIGSFENCAERVRHGADQPAVDVDRAAAHAGDDAGVGERPAFEPREDQVAPRADDVAQHADDVDLELVEPVALEDGPADADHARPELVHGKVVLWAGRPAARKQDERDDERRRARYS